MQTLVKVYVATGFCFGGGYYMYKYFYGGCKAHIFYKLI